ncbi:hypothetical protein D0865_10959 [Hortaea werneckii]|uniref:Uncharacterized protein n=1 Tax=Hortaea werneckii TaxID=91943 RepID=A0A3M7BW95_HORWE|nr:hypothetical protein D0865_10959 [Hortaea werneckii]
MRHRQRAQAHRLTLSLSAKSYASLSACHSRLRTVSDDTTFLSSFIWLTL